MRALAWFAIVLLVGIAIASPVSARVVRMETTVALADDSAPSVEQAFRQALDISVRGALAMGLSWMAVHEALVLSGAVVLRVVAADADEELDARDDGATAQEI